MFFFGGHSPSYEVPTSVERKRYFVLEYLNSLLPKKARLHLFGDTERGKRALVKGENETGASPAWVGSPGNHCLFIVTTEH